MANRTPVVLDQNPHVPEPQCRAVLERILASAEFQRAAKQRDFLSYVVDRSLAGCPEDVTEALIGHRVYGRRPTYNAGNDSIVRTEACTLRKRLERYFATEGQGEPVRLEIPRGGYVPIFRTRAGPSSPTRRRVLWLGASSAAVGAASIVAWRRRPAAGGARTEAAPPPGAVRFECSDATLVAAFEQAKQRALSCVYSGDPVGEWYATRPDAASKVFCMRDVCHQSAGAMVLGLPRHSLNMLRRFAQSTAKSRDWCGFWIITKDGIADPGSYTSDADFGYCLPASFDILRACHRQFLWTGDSSYLGADFLNYYDRTAVDFPARWDADRDGIMENLNRPRVRASYFRQAPQLVTGADLVAAQYAGYLSYAAFQEMLGGAGSLSSRLASEFRSKAAALRRRFNTEWWDADNNRFHSGLLKEHRFTADFIPECNLYSLLFGIPEDGPKTDAALDLLEKELPQYPGAYSYLPDVFFRYGRIEQACRFLREIAAPAFFGKEIGEVSFAVVGAVGTGLMGLAPDAAGYRVETQPRLPATVEWARLSRVPVLRNEITVEHRGARETILTNSAGPALRWKAAFPGVPAQTAVITVPPGQRRTARLTS